MMNTIRNRCLLNTLAIISFTFISCEKQNDWLNERRQITDVVPATLRDFQAMLDETATFNTDYSMLGLVGSDNLYIPDANLSGTSQHEKNSYLWNKEVFPTGSSSDYSSCYLRIAYANLILEGLQKIDHTATNEDEYNNIMGQALFARAYRMYALAQMFCKPYDAATETTDLGLVIRTVTNPNILFQRSNIKDTYSQIINDLTRAADLMPTDPLYRTRASSIAAKGALAKVYLSMENYDKAWFYANEVLAEHPGLLDYNNTSVIAPSSSFRFPRFTTNAAMANPEILFYAQGLGYGTTWPVYGRQFADSNLYKSYDDKDLRKTLIFLNTGGPAKVKYVGSYTGTYYNFWGIATNELYLIRAECYARKGDYQSGVKDLNKLLENRYATGNFTPVTAANADETLAKILTERRKELPFTGQLRWEDLRRLNRDPRFAITLSRVANGVTYSLPPNDKRYVFPIPQTEINLSGLVQNDR